MPIRGYGWNTDAGDRTPAARIFLRALVDTIYASGLTQTARDQYIHMQTKHPGTYNKVVHAHIGSCDRGVQLQQLIAESPWVKNRRLVRRSWTASDSLSHSGRLVWHSRQRIRLHLAELIVILLHLCKDGFDLGEQPWICPPIEP